jgi:hypothetical protein
VIHNFIRLGMACLDPKWAGGRPRRITTDNEVFIVKTAKTRPEKLGRPFTRWSIRKLASYLADNSVRIVKVGRERLRELLAKNNVTFQRTKTWKESNDPERDAKLDRIEHVMEHDLDRCFAFDEFGPLAIHPIGVAFRQAGASSGGPQGSLDDAGEGGDEDRSQDPAQGDEHPAGRHPPAAGVERGHPGRGVYVDGPPGGVLAEVDGQHHIGAIDHGWSRTPTSRWQAWVPRRKQAAPASRLGVGDATPRPSASVAASYTDQKVGGSSPSERADCCCW